MKIVLNEEELKKAISHYLSTYTGIRIDYDKLIIDEIEERIINTNKTEFYIHLEFYKEDS